MVVLAPISTSSPIRTLPICGTLIQVPFSARESESVAADHRAGLHDAARAEHHADDR